MGGRRQAECYLAPGVEAIDQGWCNIKLFSQISIHHPPMVAAHRYWQNLFWHLQRCAMGKGVGIQII
ncbi:hypothetical protein D3C76_1431180 [compost metagenome]